MKRSFWNIMFFGKFFHIIVFINFLVLFPCEIVAQTSNESPPSGESDFQSSGRYHFSPAMSIIFVLIVVVFFVIGCFSIFARRCIGSSSQGNGLLMINQVNRRSRRTGQGLDSSVIETFPTFVYSDVKKVKRAGALECAICLNEFKDDETLRLIPRCCHVFHPECIDTWLISHTTCPVCRADLVPVPGETETNNCDFSSLDDAEEHVTTHPVLLEEGRGQVQGINELETSSHKKLLGKFPRSHSTGHSLIRPNNDYEKFTLRLSGDMQKKLIKPELRRAKSNLVFPSATSSKKGYRSSSVGPGLEIHNGYEHFNHEGRQDRWGFTAAPPFFTRSRSAQAPIGGNTENNATASGSSSNHVKSSFDWLFGGSSSKDETGGRSFARMNPV